MSLTFHLRVLQTTDLHAHLRPYDYFLDTPAPGAGLAALGPLIDDARSGAQNCLLFDCGDLIQGTPMGDLAADTAPGHPAMAALAALEYDAVTLGNHDLDFGLDALLAAFTGTGPPVICANLLNDDDQPFYPFGILQERAFIDDDGQPLRLKLGLYGVLPPQTASWNGHHLKGRGSVSDAFHAARDAAASLRSAGADLIIALAHSGTGDGTAPAFAENIALAIGDKTDTDIVLAAHTHQLVPEDLTSDAPVPVLQSGAMARHLGVMDLVIQRQQEGWTITKVTRQLRQPKGKNAPHRAVMAATEDAHKATLAHIRQPIGRTEVALNSYFNLIGFDAGAALTAEAALVLARRGLGDRPCLAAVAPFRAGGAMGPAYYTDVAAGPMALRHASELYLYPNEVRFIDVSGAALRDWLDHSAGIYHQIKHSEAPQYLTKAGRPTYNADAIFGLDYKIDLSQPARFDEVGTQISEASRITDLTCKGRAVRDDDMFAVVTNSYRASGGGGFSWLADCPVLETPPAIMRDVLARHIKDADHVAPDLALPFTFEPLGGRSVRFETGPGAVPYLDTLPLQNVRSLGLSDNGFLTLEILI